MAYMRSTGIATMAAKTMSGGPCRQSTPPKRPLATPHTTASTTMPAVSDACRLTTFDGGLRSGRMASRSSTLSASSSIQESTVTSQKGSLAVAGSLNVVRPSGAL